MPDYSKPKYALGLNIQSTKHHPGYNHKRSAEWNAARGHKAHRNWAHVFRELDELYKLTHKEVFREAANLAHQRAVKEGDYATKCHSCGKRHMHKMMVKV